MGRTTTLLCLLVLLIFNATLVQLNETTQSSILSSDNVTDNYNVSSQIKNEVGDKKKEEEEDCKKVEEALRSENSKLQVSDVFYEGGLFTAACEMIGDEPFDLRAEFNLSTEDTLIFRQIYPTWQPSAITVKSKEKPLILTKFLKEGRADEGRKLARVRHPIIDPLVKTSYSGYFTVDEKYNSNLFFWFFPAQGDDSSGCGKKSDGSDKPVILWLQGGPGVSSMFGLFHEIGPLTFDKREKLKLNEFTWNKDYNLLFIDNPVGTGFSFTNHSDGYCTKQEEIGKHLYDALVQFFQVFYEYQGAPFYIAGESYAGKHIPSVAYEIKKNNPEAGIFINLQGMAIGNGFTDPENMMSYSPLLLKLGLIEQESYHLMQIIEKQAKYNMRNKRYLHAFLDWTRLLLVFLKSSGYKNMYHILDEREHTQLDVFSSFVQRSSVRRALHVGDTEFTSIGQVYASLIPDMMRSVKPQVDELLKEYRMMFYSGQLDLIVAYPLTHEGMFKDVAWGTRRFLRVDDRLAGYTTSSGNLTLVMVRNAGHMVPTDQPEWAYNIIKAFIDNKI